jgi:branched-subunit amino acid transport protein
VASETIWWVLGIMGATVFVLRFVLLALWGRLSLPRPVQRALRYVPAAVLTAITWKGVVQFQGQVQLAPDNLRLWAALIALGVALRYRNILLTMASGMAALWILTALLGQ